MNELNLEGVPTAAKVQVCYCTEAHCKRPHVVLIDDVGRIIAQFVAPDDFDMKLVDAFTTAIKERGMGYHGAA